MRRDIYLYIGGLKADLSDRSFILLNYAMNDLADPAKVSNSYSQQVTLPGTPANDAIFGDFFRPDRYISGTGTGIGYDPRKKVDFAIYAETGEIIESGYVVLNSIRSSRSGGVEYRVTLFGGLGSFFQSLSYISGTGKMQLCDLAYLGGGDGELTFTITKSAIAQAWAVDPTAGTVDGIWKVINFAPAYNGIPAGDFDAGHAVADPTSIGLADSKMSDGYTYRTRDGLTVLNLPAPVDEWAARDLRSYLQRPVLSVRAFLAAIAKPAYNGGYTVDYSALQNTDIYDSFITLPLLPEQVSGVRRGSLESSFSALWVDPANTREIGTLTLTGTAPVGSKVSGHLTIRMRFNESTGACGSPALGAYRSSETDYDANAVFLQAVGYDANNNAVAASPTKVIMTNMFTGTSFYDSPMEYLAAYCGYTSQLGKPLEQVIMSILQRTDPQNTSSPFELYNDIDLGFEDGTDVKTVKVFMYNYHVGFEGTGDAQVLTMSTGAGRFMLYDMSDHGGEYESTTCLAVLKESAWTYETSSLHSGATITKAMMLSTGHTPAEYLLALTKLVGAYYLYDPGTKKVTICRRNDVYLDETIDLTDRVDTADLELDPTTVEARWYNFSLDVAEGYFAQAYKQLYGEAYAALPIRSAYDHDANPIGVMDGVILRTAATVSKKSKYMLTVQESGLTIPAPLIDPGATYTLWNASGKGMDFPVPAVGFSAAVTYFNANFPGYDIDGAAKMQFEDASGKGVDGGDVLVKYRGKKTYPDAKVSDDTAAMMRVNGGKACWDFSAGASLAVPVYNRIQQVSGAVSGALEFGALKEYGDPAVSSVDTSGFGFFRYWSAYMNDRFNGNTKVLRCRVDFSGIQVGQELLRKFFYFRGAIWVLDKVTNHSVTTDDLTECEFVQVQNKANYLTGQY